MPQLAQIRAIKHALCKYYVPNLTLHCDANSDTNASKCWRNADKIPTKWWQNCLFVFCFLFSFLFLENICLNKLTKTKKEMPTQKNATNRHWFIGIQTQKYVTENDVGEGDDLYQQFAKLKNTVKQKQFPQTMAKLRSKQHKEMQVTNKKTLNSVFLAKQFKEFLDLICHSYNTPSEILYKCHKNKKSKIKDFVTIFKS